MDIKRLVRVGGRWGVVLTVLGAINWGVRTAGDIDFVLQSVDDPGWLKAVAVALFVSPPWFVVMGLFVLSATALYLTRGGPSLPEGESAVGSKVVTRDGVLDFADPQKAEIKPDENQQRIEELQAEVDRLSAWKEHRSDWDDEMERYGRLKDEHSGCADRMATLQARVTELEAEISEIRSGPTSADENDEDTEPYLLDEVEEKLLLAVEAVDGEGPAADYLASVTGENMTRTKYYLARLVRWGHLLDLRSTQSPTRYGITEKGRAYLVENELV